MKRLAHYSLSILSSILYFGIGLLLIVFMHPLLFLSAWVFGPKALRFCMDFIAVFAARLLPITGTRVSYHRDYELPENQPLIVISNHQSLFDIIHLIVLLRKHRPNFVAKKELGNYFPSVSPALKFGGSVLIDRNNHTQSAKQILQLGKTISKNGTAGIIFPEGTRSRNSSTNEFKTAGVKALLKSAPNAWVVPVCIKGNNRLYRKSKYFIAFGNRIDVSVLEPIKPPFGDADELVARIQQEINLKLQA